MEETTYIQRPRRIEHERNEVYIRPAALAALGWWVDRGNLALGSSHDYPNADRDFDTKAVARIEARAAADPILAQLIDFARTLPMHEQHRWDVTVRIADEHDRIAPLPAWTPDCQDSDGDTCRHGRLFTEDCPDCEI